MNYLIKKYNYPASTGICSINLPSSKSEANRLLIINALSGGKIQIENLSEARDTQTLNRLLQNEEKLQIFDVLDAGTAMRFLTAYLSVSTKKEVLLTGTERMQKRPIGTLVEALTSIGASISYEDKDGYPPLRIKPFKEQKSSNISIPGNISSQYISALLMIAPALPKGLEINIEAPVFSRPYINMTLGLMSLSGIKFKEQDNTILIAPQAYKVSEQIVESDWSASSYWFSIIAQAGLGTKIFLKGLKSDSLQGDQVIKDLAEDFGVNYKFESNGVLLEKSKAPTKNKMHIDFRKCPDLAQTVMPCAAALKVNLEMTGLESLRIKETDRIAALQNELSKFNCKLTEPEKGKWTLKSDQFLTTGNQQIATYEDHRMAMGFAPLAMLNDLTIEEESVVNKSYPGFWADLKSFGFDLLEQ